MITRNNELQKVVNFWISPIRNKVKVSVIVKNASLVQESPKQQYLVMIN